MVKLSVITVICVCKKTPKTPKMGQFIYDLTIWLPFVVFLEHFARPLTKNNDMGNLKIRALTDSSLLCSASWDRAGFNETVAYTQLPITALGSLQTSTLSFAVCGFSTKKAKLKNTRKNMPVPFTQPHPTSVMSLMLAWKLANLWINFKPPFHVEPCHVKKASVAKLFPFTPPPPHLWYDLKSQEIHGPSSHFMSFTFTHTNTVVRQCQRGTTLTSWFSTNKQPLSNPPPPPPPPPSWPPPT